MDEMGTDDPRWMPQRGEEVTSLLGSGSGVKQVQGLAPRRCKKMEKEVEKEKTKPKKGEFEVVRDWVCGGSCFPNC